jgi:LacI family transcriptional regulator
VSTLIDVARRAGVSKSTVSNVIRGASLVAEPTRLKVERAIADMGYHPNAIARALKARTSSALGIVVPDLANPFYAELAVSVERAASALGFAVLTAHTECAPTTEEEAGRALIERRVDGVIIAGVSLGSSLPGMLLDRAIPVVLASFGEPDDPRLGVIDHDDAAAMEVIVEHLYGLGHRRVAFVSQHLREYGGERRRVGFTNALAKRGLALVELDDGATAVVAHNDMLAIATIDRLERRSLRVPQDISVVGYDDVPLAAHARIRLTTVHSDAVEMGRRAVELAVGAARENRHVSLREMLSNPLVVRSTTARPPA